MSNIVNHDDRSLKEKAKSAWYEVKDWIDVKMNEVKIWFEGNWMTIIKLMPIVFGTITWGIKIAKMLKGSAADRHEDRMDKTYYDPSTGLHWDLKRDMNNSERIELSQRKRNGEFVEDILRDMRILKK